MDQESWRTLLSIWSEDILRYEDEATLRALPAEVRASRWLGYPGATEGQLAAAEARLGCALPPSYRTFLSITNGWRQTSPFIYEVWSTEQIDWLPRSDPEFIAAWMEGERQYGPLVIPDEDYFVYGEEQYAHNMRNEYLNTALQISGWGDAAFYLLNPLVITPEGEWEAWFLATWVAGANRYRTFWDLMRAEHETFLMLERP